MQGGLAGSWMLQYEMFCMRSGELVLGVSDDSKPAPQPHQLKPRRSRTELDAECPCTVSENSSDLLSPSVIWPNVVSLILSGGMFSPFHSVAGSGAPWKMIG